MNEKKYSLRSFKLIFSTLIGFSLGVCFVWPGIIKVSGRKCFLKIIKDGSDGNISLSTIFSMNPHHIVKIKNAKNRYLKILSVGDFCFRKFWENKKQNLFKLELIRNDKYLN